MSAGSKCQVCSAQRQRYRCPTCRIPYCSVACFKVHKENRCEAKEEVARTAPRGGGGDVRVEDAIGESGDRVASETLDWLRSSEEVKDLLSNPHLRAIIRELNASASVPQFIDKCMREPIFTEFANACLRSVREGPAGVPEAADAISDEDDTN
ncbi:PREDICTED: zinc finger HIT domain-containing protein 3-like [Priapulus caudatus]|uniref:Zinc finger HIT domain-containing protein 3 n=1 Tax=Priapulus caudatus TaxID=37621 RepID=A0ABM1DQJ6_PRICU|nr:PREDICTED: zinc finger HIT domain-containing protein 3-like [Priapulus caudatus]